MNLHTHFNQATMKAISFSFKLVLCTILIGLSTISCDKDDEPDVYYVKYKMESSTPYTGGELSVVFTSDKGNDEQVLINPNTSWETTIGPVEKGFTAEIYIVNRKGTEAMQIYSEIDVSKNGSPFAIKAYEGQVTPRVNRSTLSTGTKYTIDF